MCSAVIVAVAVSVEVADTVADLDVVAGSAVTKLVAVMR